MSENCKEECSNEFEKGVVTATLILVILSFIGWMGYSMYCYTTQIDSIKKCAEKDHIFFDEPPAEQFRKCVAEIKP